MCPDAPRCNESKYDSGPKMTKGPYGFFPLVTVWVARNDDPKWTGATLMVTGIVWILSDSPAILLTIGIGQISGRFDVEPLQSVYLVDVRTN